MEPVWKAYGVHTYARMSRESLTIRGESGVYRRKRWVGTHGSLCKAINVKDSCDSLLDHTVLAHGSYDLSVKST